MGVAAADYDADGNVDLYVSNYGPNILYRNNGNGTFTDVSEKAGVTAPGWSTCATWFDYDNDNRLDLFVSSFVFTTSRRTRFAPIRHCSVVTYCAPRLFKPTPSYLYRNGRCGLSDVSRESGIAAHPGKSFGAVATDINNDGLLDLFVANDTMPNFLFLNKGKGKFEEIDSPQELRTANQDGLDPEWASMRPITTPMVGRICCREHRSGVLQSFTTSAS